MFSSVATDRQTVIITPKIEYASKNVGNNDKITVTNVTAHTEKTYALFGLKKKAASIIQNSIDVKAPQKNGPILPFSNTVKSK